MIKIMSPCVPIEVSLGLAPSSVFRCLSFFCLSFNSSRTESEIVKVFFRVGVKAPGEKVEDAK